MNPTLRDDFLRCHDGRHVLLEGGYNCRDIGGLQTSDGRLTRGGVLFRSDSLATVTAQDREILAAHGIRAIYDLRTEEERRKSPNLLPRSVAEQFAWGFIPRGNPEMIGKVNAGQLSAEAARAEMCVQYERLALDHTAELGKVYRRLLAPGGAPAIVHCASGKDRTGVSTAILLLTIGVLPELVFEDYLISNYRRRKVDLFIGEAPSDAVEQIMSARAEYLAAALAAITREFGDFEAFVTRGLGLSASERAALTALLVT